MGRKEIGGLLASVAKSSSLQFETPLVCAPLTILGHVFQIHSQALWLCCQLSTQTSQTQWPLRLCEFIFSVNFGTVLRNPDFCGKLHVNNIILQYIP